MDPDTRIERQDGLLESEIDGEIVGLHLATDACYGFNPTASAIWRALATPQTFGALCGAMAETFEVDEETCARDVAALVGELADDGLLKLVPTGAA